MPDAFTTLAQSSFNKIKDTAQKLFSGISNNAGNIASGVLPPVGIYNAFHNTVPQIQQSLQNFGQFNPRASGFITQSVAPKLDKISSFLQQPYKPIELPSMQSNAPSNAPFITKLPSMAGAAGYNNLVKPVIEGVANFPTNYIGGVTRTGIDLGKMNQGQQVSGKKALADIGSVAKGLLDVSILPGAAGVAEHALSSVGHKTLGSVVKEGAITGAKFGGAYGAVQGLIDNQDIKDTAHYLTNVFANTGTGAAGGAIMGGGLAGASYISGKVIGTTYNFFKSKGENDETAASQTSKYLRDSFGRFASKISEPIAELQKRIDSIPLNSFDDPEVKTLGDWNRKYGQAGFIDFGANVGDQEPTLNSSQKRLGNLLNYGKDLIDRGYTPREVDNIPYSKYKEIVANNIEPEMYRLNKQELAGFVDKNPNADKNLFEKLRYNWNESFARVHNMPEEFQKDFSSWVNKHQAARTKATMVAEQFRSIPEDLGMDVINNIETPNPNAPQEVKVWTEALNKKFSELYLYAQQSGIDIGHLKNYITHIWQEDPAQVEQVMKSASKNFKFAKERTLPTYQEGLALGLTPKYTNPSQIVGEYVSRLEKTKANIEFLNVLKNQDLISTKYKPGLLALHGMGMEGKYAKPQVAALINDMFKPQQPEGMLHMAGNLSGVLQDVSMAGGIPGTPVNAFTLGQITKEVTAGRAIPAFKSLMRALSDDKSQQYFKNNADVVKEMQLNGIPIHTTYDYENFYKNPDIAKTLGDRWHAAFNSPTFERFIPSMQIEFFKEAKSKFGSEVAARATKAFYGIINDEVIGRPKETADFLKTFFFAHRFRESALNFWGHAFNPKELMKPENYALRRFWIGVGLTVAAYDALNYKGTGKHLYQNPPGKELTALVPIGDTTIGLPILPSVATLPRMFVSMGNFLAHGQTKEAGLELRKSTSTLIKPFLDVMSNEDYFGSPIYKEEDSSVDKWKKILGYIGGQWNHPYIREALSVLTGQKPLGQAIINATEAPIRFYKTQNLVSSDFWDEYEGLKKEMDSYKNLSPQEKTAFEQKNQDKILNFVAMTSLVNAYSDIKNSLGTDKAKEYLTTHIPEKQVSKGSTVSPVAPMINQADNLTKVKGEIRRLAELGFSYPEIVKHVQASGFPEPLVQETLKDYYSASQLKSRALVQARSLTGQGLSQENVSARLASAGYNPDQVLPAFYQQQAKRLTPTSRGRKLAKIKGFKGIKAKTLAFGKTSKTKKIAKLKKFKLPKNTALKV